MDQQKLTLFWNLGSQPARAVEALLRIGNIEHKLVSKDVVKEQTRSREFLEMNPMGQIPFLIHGNLKIGESNAIMVYLCQAFADKIPKHYYGSTAEERAITNQHISWYQYHFRPALFKIIKLKIYGVVRKQQEFQAHQLKGAKRQMQQALRTLDLLLEKGKADFVAGNRPTIADLLIYFQLLNLEYYGEELRNCKMVQKWKAQVEKMQQVRQINREWAPVCKQVRATLDKIVPKGQSQPKL